LNLGEKLTESVSSKVVFNINIFGHNIPISDTIVVMWFIMLIIIVAAILLTKNLKTIPDKKQNIIESIVEFVNNTAKNSIGHHGLHFAPYIGTILLFLAVSNIVSIFNIFPGGEFWYHLTGVDFLRNIPTIKPPTKNINLNAVMAIMSIIMVMYAGIRFKGFKGWLKTFIEPMPVILPFKILDYFIRPVSLTLRLFGNILAAFMIMELIYIAVPAFVPAAFSIYFDLFDGLLQAYIFVFLTSIYIAEVVE
jgi:F-type H+-transporting ATPase subunit a